MTKGVSKKALKLEYKNIKNIISQVLHFENSIHTIFKTLVILTILLQTWFFPGIDFQD